MGCLGMLAAQALPHGQWRVRAGRASPEMKPLMARLLAGVLLFVLLGLAPGTDVMAHFGGFLTGFLMGWPLAFIPQPSRYGKLNLLAAFSSAALVIVPWWLAIRAASLH